MGNLIDGDRWRFDAATNDSEEEKLTGRHWITGIFWTESADRDIAADDNLLITDKDGLVIYEMTAAGTPATASNHANIVIPDPGLLVDGFKLPLLDGGILVIWRKLPYT